MDDVPWLHIRSQHTYHFEATIRGTQRGLEALKDALEIALQSGAATTYACASDGEGYEVHVARSSAVAGIGKPTYLDQEARELASREYAFLTRQYRNNRPIEKEAFEALAWCRANGNPHFATTPPHNGGHHE